jgi:hypothetical protein
MSKRRDKTGQPRVRSWVAVSAQMRNSAGAHGKRGKGRTRRQQRSRQDVRANLRRGDW